MLKEVGFILPQIRSYILIFSILLVSVFKLECQINFQLIFYYIQLATESFVLIFFVNLDFEFHTHLWLYSFSTLRIPVIGIFHNNKSFFSLTSLSFPWRRQ